MRCCCRMSEKASLTAIRSATIMVMLTEIIAMAMPQPAPSAVGAADELDQTAIAVMANAGGNAEYGPKNRNSK